MGYPLDPLLSHQSISDCHHAVELKLQVQDPQQGVLFPIKRKENGKSRYKDSVQDIFGLFNLDNSLRFDQHSVVVGLERRFGCTFGRAMCGLQELRKGQERFVVGDKGFDESALPSSNCQSHGHTVSINRH